MDAPTGCQSSEAEPPVRGRGLMGAAAALTGCTRAIMSPT